MTPAYSPERGRTRREGNITYIQTEFATRLRFLVIWEAKQQARQAVIRRIKAEGKVKVSLMSASEITHLANAHLRKHAAELVAQAEASRVVQNLRLAHEQKLVDLEAKSLCSSPVRNRMHMIGYFEGIDSERGIAWRCSDSLSLRAFLRLSNRDKVPDHSWLSKTRSRLPHEVHEKVFGWVLDLVAGHGLVKGERIGVDGSTMEANAALRTIVRRDSGESYREMLTRMAQESGVATPTIDDLVRLDRKRQGKKLSNEDWTSPTDPDAKIAKMKDGTTHLAYKPEHAVDLDTGVIVAAPIHAADEGDTTTLEPTLAEVQKSLSAVGLTPTAEDPCDLVADKGYHSRAVLKALADGAWKTRIAEPLPSRGYLSWHGDEAARAAVYGNRTRLRSCVGKEAMRKRGEIVERSFAHVG